MIKITDITIGLHCGCSKDIVNAQIETLKPLTEKYNLHWNNRIDRYPLAYPSYSQLINHAIATSPTQFFILINDRTHPKVFEVEKIINHLENGFACSLMYNVGFMGFSRELVRKIGWWDERFLNGGWEDRDWIFRLKQHNLAIYESQEATYDYSWKSPLQVVDNCKLSNAHWYSKYTIASDTIVKNLKEERYEHWDLFLGRPAPAVAAAWRPWSESILNLKYVTGGQSGSSIIGNRSIVEA